MAVFTGVELIWITLLMQVSLVRPSSQEALDGRGLITFANDTRISNLSPVYAADSA